MSGRHFSLCPVGDGVTIADAGSTNGTVVAGEPLHARRDLAEGDLIWAGRTALVVARAPAADAPLSPGEDGRLRYSRSPRLAERPRARAIALPDPPPEPQKTPFPVLAVLVPVIAGLIMALVLRQPEFLAFIALSPVMLIGNAVSERRRGKRGHQQAMADYEQRREQAMASLAAARQAELRYRRHVHPDPGAPAADRRRAQPPAVGASAAGRGLPDPAGRHRHGPAGSRASRSVPAGRTATRRMSCATPRLPWPCRDCGAVGITGSAGAQPRAGPGHAAVRRRAAQPA